MSRPTSRAARTAAAALLLAAGRRASAQPETALATRPVLSLAAGAVAREGIDEAISPVRFGGHGGAVAAGYGRSIGRLAISASVRGGVASLGARAAASASTERTGEGEGALTVVRAFGDERHGAGAVGAGVDVRAGLAFTEHRYAATGLPASHHAFGYGALGPAAAWRRALAGGTASGVLAAPLVALVDRPYSDLKAARPRVALRAAAPGEFRALHGGLAYAPATGRRVGLVGSWTFDVRRYDDVQPVRAVSQRVAVGVVARFGGAAGAGARPAGVLASAAP